MFIKNKLSKLGIKKIKKYKNGKQKTKQCLKFKKFLFLEIVFNITKIFKANGLIKYELIIIARLKNK